MKICNDLCNFPRIANISREKVYCSVCAKLYHESYAQKNRCICCGTPVRLFNKTRRKEMSWYPIRAKDYNKDNPKDTRKKDQRVTQVKTKIPTNMKSNNSRWTEYCPRLCQQKSNGSKGKKTFDGIICNACKYQKKINPSS